MDPLEHFSKALDKVYDALEPEERFCPICESLLVDGRCTDAGDNCCQYVLPFGA